MSPADILERIPSRVQRASRVAGDARSEYEFREAAELLDSYFEQRSQGALEPPGGDELAKRLRLQLSGAWEDRMEEDRRDRAVHADYFQNQGGAPHHDRDCLLPTVSVEANERSKLKRPKLVDAREMARDYPDTFILPPQQLLDSIGAGDIAKVNADGERFWVRITGRDSTSFQGTVDNELVRSEDHGLELGDRIRFEERQIYDAMSKESAARLQEIHADFGFPAASKANGRRRMEEERSDSAVHTAYFQNPGGDSIQDLKRRLVAR